MPDNDERCIHAPTIYFHDEETLLQVQEIMMDIAKAIEGRQIAYTVLALTCVLHLAFEEYKPTGTPSSKTERKLRTIVERLKAAAAQVVQHL